MNKRELSKVNRPVATEEMWLLAEKIEKEKYLITTELIDILGEKILLLNFFEISQLILKKTGAAFRTFLFHNDYITQDLKLARVKWKSGCFYNMLNWCQWEIKRNGYSVKLVSNQDYYNLSQYMKKYQKSEDNDIWDAVIRFQHEVMERRLTERHKKITDKIDKKMELLPEKPKGFHKWVYDKAMADKRYLIYKTRKQRYLTGYCTNCKREVRIDTRRTKPKNKQQGKCPVCGGEITFIPRGYFPKCQENNKWVCLIQRVQGGIVTRYFHVRLEIQRDSNFKESFSIRKLYRVFYEEDKKELKRDVYEWNVYKQRGACRWCPISNIYLHNAVLYVENLPQEFIGTIFQYYAADLYQEKKGCEPIPIFQYLEYFIKIGLLNLTKDVLTKDVSSLNTSGKTPTEILNMPMEYIKTLAEIDRTKKEYLLLKQCVADKIIPNARDIQQFYERFGGNDKMLGVVNIHMDIGKFVRYIDKQKKMLPKQQEQQCCYRGMMYGVSYSRAEKEQMRYKDIGHDWLDYISWCARLEYNMQDKYVLLPPDLKKAHDRVMKEYQINEDKLERKRLAEMEQQLKKIRKESKDFTAMEMKTEKLMIVIPKSLEEIKAEGRILHHCVGTYVERVAKGETMILFVRKVDKPKEPYFTLEYRSGKIVQCRGKNNCSMTKEVQAFVQAFEKKAKGTVDKNKTKKRRKVG